MVVVVVDQTFELFGMRSPALRIGDRGWNPGVAPAAVTDHPTSCVVALVVVVGVGVVVGCRDRFAWWNPDAGGERGCHWQESCSVVVVVVVVWSPISPYYRTRPLDQNQHGNGQPRAARHDTTTMTTAAARRQEAPPLLVRLGRRLECHSGKRDSALLSNTTQREGINPQVSLADIQFKI